MRRKMKNKKRIRELKEKIDDLECRIQDLEFLLTQTVRSIENAQHTHLLIVPPMTFPQYKWTCGNGTAEQPTRDNYTIS